MTPCTKYDRLKGEKGRRNSTIVIRVIGMAVVLFVPALVWAAVIAGLYQIVRDKVRESGPTQIELASGSAAAEHVEERG